MVWKCLQKAWEGLCSKEHHPLWGCWLKWLKVAEKKKGGKKAACGKKTKKGRERRRKAEEQSLTRSKDVSGK